VARISATRVPGGPEAGSDLLGGLKWTAAKGILDDPELVGDGGGPGLFAAGGGGCFIDEAGEGGGDGDGVGGLVLGAEPANEAGCLFGAALGV
jgi:hypothetical protein